MQKNDVFIGNIIQRIVKERKIKVEDFAKSIGYSRTQVYSAVFYKKSIDFMLLRKISNVLSYDLESEYNKEKEISEQYLLLIKTDKDVDIEEILKMISSKASIEVLKKWQLEGV